MCIVCGHRGGGSEHHEFWPRRKFKNAKIGIRKKTHDIHPDCHRQYHYFWYQHCQKERICTGCRFQKICCYFDA